MTDASPDRPLDRRRDAARSRILESAADLVLAEGVDALTMRRVAERADYAVGALYRYFASADALLAAVALQVLDRLATTLQTAHKSAATPLDALCAMVDAYCRFAVADPHGFALISSLVSDRRFLVSDAENVSTITLAVGRALQPVQAALEAAEAAGQLSAGDAPATSLERAFALFAAVQGALLLDKLARRAPGLFDADATARLVATSMFIGWGAPAAALTLRSSSC